MEVLKILQSKFALSPNDNQDDRLQKVSALIISGSCTIAGIVWFIMYFWVLGITFTTYLPLLFSIIVGSAIAISHFKKNHLVAVYAQIICIIYITAAIQWSMGGVFTSGFVLAWSIIGPLTALIFLSFRQSSFWLILFLVNILITVIYDQYFDENALYLPETTKHFFFTMNLGMTSLVVFIFARYFVSNAMDEKRKSEQLLLNILPAEIADELKHKGKAEAQSFEHVSVLFTDFKSFTQVSEKMIAQDLVATINECFEAFDAIVYKYGIEKIKTIGDAYMAAGGLPIQEDESVTNTVLAALELQAFISTLHREKTAKGEHAFEMRLGIHTGPIVAGIVGSRKFQYDIWGDTVNTASRMESYGVVGKVNISQTTYELIKDDPQFIFEHRGKVEVKGKGEIDMYFVSLG